MGLGWGELGGSAIFYAGEEAGGEFNWLMVGHSDPKPSDIGESRRLALWKKQEIPHICVNICGYQQGNLTMQDAEKAYLRKVGGKVRDHRKEKGISQEELALRCELSINHIGRIERGETNTTVVMLKRIADALGVNESQLLEK
jgi:DNA-binding XRE family transcriptional regulator